MTDRLKRTRHPGIYETGKSYIVRYRDQSGRQRQKTCRTLDEAKRWRAKVTLNPAAGSPRSGPTVSEYAEDWLSVLAGVRPATAIEYRRDLEKFVLTRIGGVRIGAIDARRIRRLAYDLREEGTSRAPSGRSWSTVRRILAPLSAMLGAASEDGVIPARPWPRLPTPRRDPLKRRHLSVDELVRLLAALPTPPARLLVRFLAETGLRISELKALRWRDLELDDEPAVSVRRRHRLLDGEQETKSEQSSGTVPITAQLARELKAHRLRNGQPGAGELVFTGPSGSRIEEANYRRRVLDPACVRAGIAPIGFHVLRHTHGSIVAAATRDVRAVQRRLRHASASFTLETYIHLLDDRAGVDAVADALESRSTRRTEG
ncbi:MAG: tyrosine-type recombinase/integrase [Gaiellaceae bacterium]